MESHEVINRQGVYWVYKRKAAGIVNNLAFTITVAAA